MPRVEADLASVAREQYGVFSRAQAVQLGLSPSQVVRARDAGRYLRLHRGVYAVAGIPPSWRQSVMAAVLASGPGAAASHRTAAHLWSLTSRPPRIEVVMRRWDRARHDFVVHESTDLSPLDIVYTQGIAVTTAVRTVVDLGATAPWAVESALDAGLRSELFSAGEVARFVRRVARRGRRGVGVIRPFLEERLGWDDRTESELEDRFRRVIVEQQLPMPIAQFVVRDTLDRFVCRADFAYPESRVLIELDSEAFHMNREAFRSDRSKQNRTSLLGYTTLRYTWWDLDDTPAVGAQLRAALS